MTIRSVADARIIMFAIHGMRAESGNQNIERRMEDMIATERRGGKAIFVEDELARIERATELDGIDLDGLARDILRRSDDAR